jgi:hypothetical protein
MVILWWIVLLLEWVGIGKAIVLVGFRISGVWWMVLKIWLLAMGVV